MTTKQKMWAVGIVAILIFAWIGWNFFDEPTIRNMDSRGTTIVAFGDSLVEGVGATEGNDLVSQLSKRIGEPIVNPGKSGDTTADAILRIDSVLAENPRLVIVLLGGNDYLRRVPMSETFANLDTIVSKIQDRGAMVLLLGVRGGLLKDNYNSEFKKFAKTHEAGFVPNVLDGLIGDTSLMSDTIHPNDRGYALIADKVAPVLAKMLKR